MSTSPLASGQRPSISRCSQASARDQKVTTPRSALNLSDWAMTTGSCHRPGVSCPEAATAARSASSSGVPESGVKTRLRPVRPVGVSWSRVTT
jgi:hypothetical protein